jgi:Rrf2 family transcriptional regulator, iron-sulfur cluster assembly transcription factor
MKLSTRCRYATLALFDIAFHNDGKPTQVRQIAERQQLPARFLEQIFQDLRRAELVEGRRGRNGGYYLHREPSEITLADIMQATDGPLEATFCLTEETDSDAQTDERSVSALVWKEVAQRIQALYAEYTLDDLVRRAEEAGLQRGAPGYMYFI